MAMSETAGMGGLEDRTIPRVGRVSARRIESSDVVTLDVETPEGPMRYAPGQFNMLTAFGVGESAISISGDPASGRLVHTVRAIGPVSRALCNLRPGDAIGVRGPFGVGWPIGTAATRDLLFVAGGLGLAPLRPAIYAALAERSRYGKIAILYGARSPDSIIFRRELEGWRGRFDLHVEATVDHALDDWRGHVGVVTKLISDVEFDAEQATAFACGPEIMMRFVAQALVAREMRESDIHLSMERNMKCGYGQCGHCQFGPFFVCRDGPVFAYEAIRPLLALREI